MRQALEGEVPYGYPMFAIPPPALSGSGSRVEGIMPSSQPVWGSPCKPRPKEKNYSLGPESHFEYNERFGGCQVSARGVSTLP
jgi:hypothetical protein